MPKKGTPQAESIGGMVLKTYKKKKRKKLSLKRAVKSIAKIIYKHLVKLPEEERERDIATFERALAKKFKRRRAKKRRRDQG